MPVDSAATCYGRPLVLKHRKPAAHLVNTAAVKQYDGSKHSGDFQDARHLAHLLRLGNLPTGYIDPREQRAVRDLLRKPSQPDDGLLKKKAVSLKKRPARRR